ncbi:MAG: hypothetical protein ACI8S6_001450 [Myxococcota bacterium]|jgi:hypothetical protein
MSETTPSVPEWADFWAPDVHAAFLKTLEAALAEREMAPALDPEAGVATFTDPTSGEERSFAMRGVAYICAEAGASDTFRQTIDQQIDLLLVGYADNEQAGELDGDWERARPVLKIRLYPLDQVQENDDILLFRPIGGDLAAVLVYDLPDSIFSVEPGVAASWPVTTDEIWSAALENIRTEEPPPSIDRLDLGEAEAVIAFGDSFFVTSRILLLGDVMDEEDFPHGALVVVPHRHALIFHPITTSTSTLDALNELILVADEMFAEGPGSLSPDVYWWRPERIERIPVAIDDEAGELIIDPPDDFVDLINSLPTGDADPIVDAGEE